MGLLTAGKDCAGYGTSWDPKAAECAGGFDSGYIHPVTGKRFRDKCSQYSVCAAKTCSSKTIDKQAQPLVPPGRLTQGASTFAPNRPYQTVTTSPATVRYPQAPRPPFQQQQQQAVAHGHYVRPWEAAQGPQYVPANYQMPGAQIPGYLTNPEPVTGDVGWARRLFHELTRSALKSMCHTGANFFDHTSFSIPKPPKQ